NPRRPVLHAEVDRVDTAVRRIGIKQALQLTPEVHRDGEQWCWHADPAITGAEFVHRLARRRPSSTDVGVVGVHVFEAVWTAIRHEQYGDVIRRHERTPRAAEDARRGCPAGRRGPG